MNKFTYQDQIESIPTGGVPIQMHKLNRRVVYVREIRVRVASTPFSIPDEKI